MAGEPLIRTRCGESMEGASVYRPSAGGKPQFVVREVSRSTPMVKRRSSLASNEEFRVRVLVGVLQWVRTSNGTWRIRK